jgi:Tol biopolymer transport system component
VFDCNDPCNQADAPAWSPDGSTLAFATYDAHGDAVTNGRVAVLDLRTGKVRTIITASDDLHDFMWPRWSPDGRRLVLELQRWSDPSFSADLQATAIGVVDLARRTPGLRLLTPAEGWASSPDWHPSKDLIVYFTQPIETTEVGPSDLMTIRPDGSHLQNVTSSAPGDPRPVQPTWTPDGRRIIFALARADWSDPRMYTIRADGAGLVPATADGPRFGTHPRLRPLP